MAGPWLKAPDFVCFLPRAQARCYSASSSTATPHPNYCSESSRCYSTSPPKDERLNAQAQRRGWAISLFIAYYLSIRNGVKLLCQLF